MKAHSRNGHIKITLTYLHEPVRHDTTSNELERCNLLIKNGKYYLSPPKDNCTFKELFQKVVYVGAGRPVCMDGFLAGSWTPEHLANAISQLEGNQSGIELRTVQRWFQNDDLAINADNIRWLARIFGCDDPEATREWQVAFSAAKAQVIEKRRDNRAKGARSGEAKEADLQRIREASSPRLGSGLARRSETFFNGSPLDLASSVFAGAAGLGFLAYFLGIHSIAYEAPNNPMKQVGFLWAPNWTFLFMLFLPLFFAFTAELMGFWKNEGRPRLLAMGDQENRDDGWTKKIEASSYTYWAVFLICVAFAGVFQWIATRWKPLIEVGAERSDYAMDWGTIALINPEIISVEASLVFTAFAYLYMCLCFYLFFAGLILLFTVSYDFLEIRKASRLHPNMDTQRVVNEIGLRIMRGIFRCTVVGVMAGVCMKLQSFYLSSSGENIWAWLADDFNSVWISKDVMGSRIEHSRPTHYSSFLIILSVCFVFVSGCIQIGGTNFFHGPMSRMSLVIALLISGYLMIGVFAGFSILLSASVILAMYGIFEPTFRKPQVSEQKAKGPNVS